MTEESFSSSARPILSVVVEVKGPVHEKLALCVGSFAALQRSASIEIVIVSCGEDLHFDPATTRRLWRLVVMPETPLGVYAAYNSGCRHATADRVLFFGADDIALPGMDAMLDAIDGCGNDTVLHAAPCIMQGRGLHAPSAFRLGIVFRNWCHQGIVYRRSLILAAPYQLKYRIQADHHTNILILSVRAHRYRILREPVAYFSAGGISTTAVDWTFRADLAGIARRTFGPHAGFLVWLKQRLADIRRSLFSRRRPTATGGNPIEP